MKFTSFLYGLVELLSKKGIVTIKKLDERKRQVAELLVKIFTKSSFGLMYQDPEYDKYSLTKKQMSIARTG